MPTFRGLTVRITRANGDELAEWGLRQLPTANTVSCYIESESDMQFRITIAPRLSTSDDGVQDKGADQGPEGEPSGGSGLEALEKNRKRMRSDENTTAVQMRHDKSRRLHRQSLFPSYLLSLADRKTTASDNIKVSVDSYEQSLSRYCSQINSSSVDSGRAESFFARFGPGLPYTKITQPPSSPGHEHRPWHLLASVYLDGRKKPERRGIVYVDPRHPDFKGTGKVTMSHRWVQDEKGTIRQHGWIFKDVSIETLLDRLLVNGNAAADGSLPASEEEELIAAMKAADLEGKEEKKQAGQIVMTLTRVTVGKQCNDFDFQAMHRKEDTDTTSDDQEMTDLSHTIGIGRGKTERRAHDPVRTVSYREVQKDEIPFATFRFYYRSKDVLRKFNFEDFPRENVPKPRVKSSLRRRLNDKFSSITPLSFSNVPKSLPQRPPSRQDEEGSSHSPMLTPAVSEDNNTTSKPNGKKIFRFKGIREIKGVGGDLNVSEDEISEVEQSEASAGINIPRDFGHISSADKQATPLMFQASDRNNMMAQSTNASSSRGSPPLLADEADDEADPNRSRVQRAKKRQSVAT